MSPSIVNSRLKTFLVYVSRIKRKLNLADRCQTPAVALSTFHLSSLPTVSARRTHLRQLLSLSSSYLILIDRSSPSGWAAISEAREYLLSLSDPENPLHAIAPCPHDAPCPLANGRDACGFSQRLQRPSFLRKTKHSGRGEEDIGYCYLVIRRGERPAAHLNELGMGRVGGAGKEAAEKARKKMQGKNFLREVEGGEFEMVSLAESESCASPSVHRVEAEEVDIEALRKEAYSWPRLVAPPLKRSGHVIMDTCSPNGMSPMSRQSNRADLKQASYSASPSLRVTRSRAIMTRAKPAGGTSFLTSPKGRKWSGLGACGGSASLRRVMGCSGSRATGQSRSLWRRGMSRG
jgi:hypothetical protein